MRYAILGMLLLFALGDGCSPPPNIVGVQDFGRVTGRVLDAMTNRPIPNALLSVGSLYTTRADVRGAFTLRAVTGDQTVTARAPGYTTATADTTITKDTVVSIGYIRLVPLVHPEGQPTLAPPPTPSPAVSATPAAASPAAGVTPAAVASPHAGTSPLASPTMASPSPTST
jgi:Carboxypeptidase regulatory-like domain